MIKNTLKKLFIKFSRILGYEIIDQNEFVSPTLSKELNQNLSMDLPYNLYFLQLNSLKNEYHCAHASIQKLTYLCSYRHKSEFVFFLN